MYKRRDITARIFATDGRSASKVSANRLYLLSNRANLRADNYIRVENNKLFGELIFPEWKSWDSDRVNFRVTSAQPRVIVTGRKKKKKKPRVTLRHIT